LGFFAISFSNGYCEFVFVRQVVFLLSLANKELLSILCRWFFFCTFSGYNFAAFREKLGLKF